MPTLSRMPNKSNSNNCNPGLRWRILPRIGCRWIHAKIVLITTRFHKTIWGRTITINYHHKWRTQLKCFHRHRRQLWRIKKKVMHRCPDITIPVRVQSVQVVHSIRIISCISIRRSAISVAQLLLPNYSNKIMKRGTSKYKSGKIEELGKKVSRGISQWPNKSE